LNKSLKADFAEAAASMDFSPPDKSPPSAAFVNRGFKENQSQKLALAGSEGFSAWLSAQPEGRR